MPRHSRFSRVTYSMLALAALPIVLACGDAAKYSGDWQRQLSGEGDVRMHLTRNGRIELMLPSPRWPDSVDMKLRGSFDGDTLVFKADTSAYSCQKTDARYVVSREGNELRIAGLGMDDCGGRRAGLVGKWEKV